MTLPASATAASSDVRTEADRVPLHVAIIMDGNGRWAVGRGLSRSDGHRAGTENVRRSIESFAQAGVKYLTLYAFSTENWERPSAEVNALISIFRDVIESESENLNRQGVRIRHIGSLQRLPDDLRHAIEDSIALTNGNDRLTLSVAFNYGSRAEILNAVRRLISDGVDPDGIDESLFAGYLDTADIPDPDLIIRTAGEMRLSNFLLWQAAYAEFYSTSALWPDFDEVEVEKALDAYSRRMRKFGRVEA